MAKSSLLKSGDRDPGSSVAIEITPTPAEYEQLCRDLKALRDLGSPSNTAAIITAVHAVATGKMSHDKRKNAGRR